MKALLLSLALLLPVSALAAYSPNEVYYGPAGAPAMRFRHYFSLGADLSYAIFGTNDGVTAQPRGMALYGLDAALGAHYLIFDLALAGEYRLWRQMKDPGHYGGTNLQGNEFSWGPLLGLNFGRIALVGKWYLGSAYKLSQVSAGGLDQEFTKPASSYAAQLRYRESWGYWGVEYRTVSYEKVRAGSSDAYILESARPAAHTYGLIAGFYL